MNFYAKVVVAIFHQRIRTAQMQTAQKTKTTANTAGSTVLSASPTKQWKKWSIAPSHGE